MFVHTVLFHLKKDLPQDAIAEFEAALNSLKAIKASRATYIGTVSETKDRPVVRSDYSYNLTILFDDIEGHNQYQVDPLHKAFVAQCSKYWTHLEIIDAD